MLGGIKIVRESSRHNIEKKLNELREEKDKGNITLEEYDTLRIRYERKLGNKETVSKLQESKGFKPSRIKEKKAKKQELYDEFVDKYSKSDEKDYGQIQRSNIFSKSTSRTILLLVVLLAFAVGIVAGLTVMNNNAAGNNSTNVTITDSAFSANQTITSVSNLSANNTGNVTYNTKKSSTASKKDTTTKKPSSTPSSSSSSGSSGSSSSGSSSGSSGSGSSSGSSSSSGGSGSSSN